MAGSDAPSDEAKRLGLAVWACVLVDQEESPIADDAPDFPHQAQLRWGEEVV